MAFFLIVPSVMVVSILLVHALAKRMGLRIYYATLVAVAVLSFMVLFAAAFVAPAVGKKFLMVAGLMILGASALVTAANKFLHDKQLAEERRFTEEVKAAYAAEVRKDSSEPAAPITGFDWGDPDDFRAIGKYNEFVTDEPVADEPVTDEPVADEPVADEPVADEPVADEPVAD
ncbi:MAG: hypothetical protein SR2Q5_07240, partial [Quinella sp. 2Q5]|nr:hypothetical protein [Quinella sp. 2Q5]